MSKKYTMNDDKVLVIGFDDNADGFAYITALRGTTVYGSFPAAVAMLQYHDHVCITEPDVYSHLGESSDFLAYAPHSINLEAGQFAFEENCKQFVNRVAKGLNSPE